MSKTLLAGYFIWGVFFFVLLCLRPGSSLHSITMDAKSKKVGWLFVLTLTMTILLCVIPMGLSPSYNGEKPDYMNQYELLTESFLEGHLYIDYNDIDPKTFWLWTTPTTLMPERLQTYPFTGITPFITAIITCTSVSCPFFCSFFPTGSSRV